MGTFIQWLLLVITGIILLWIGYCIFFGKLSPFYPFFFWKKRENLRGEPGDSQVCPVCSIKLIKGDLIKSYAFPSAGTRDRLMYIRGCFACLEHDIPRRCPICKKSLSVDDYLITRMFERPRQKNHVHVLGCNLCKGNLVK